MSKHTKDRANKAEAEVERLKKFEKACQDLCPECAERLTARFGQKEGE